MSHLIELTVRNRPEEIAALQDQLEQFAAAKGCSGSSLHQAQLALEEHLTNICNYAYDDSAEHRVIVRIELSGRDLRIQVTDDGRPFNPLEYPAPDLSVPIDQRPIGGLGIYMLRKSVDQVEYRRENNRNILVISKRV